jgi:hypothetical protein
MHDHRLFYFPYASFTDAQLPLLKVAALYFDKLCLLDPVGASWATVGADEPARAAVQVLAAEQILEKVNPSEVLARYGYDFAEAVRGDMRDQDFLELCERHAAATGRRRWTLALAKVPQDHELDSTLRAFMGDFARDVSAHTAYAAEEYIEHREALASLPGLGPAIPGSVFERAQEYGRYRETGVASDDSRDGYEGTVEYRYADFPLALGEAFMTNHALFAGLLHAQATPITDETFHSNALSLKLRRAAGDQLVRDALSERTRAQGLGADLLSVAALTDFQLDLPIIDPRLPLDVVLEYRQEHSAELDQARAGLGWMARRIESEPWTNDFAAEIEHKTIPDLAAKLDEARQARDAWRKTKRGRLALGAAGAAVAGASAVLTVVAAPVTPIALVIGATTLASGSAIPGLAWLLEWRAGKHAVQENGLHYLINMPKPQTTD